MVPTTGNGCHTVWFQYLNKDTSYLDIINSICHKTLTPTPTPQSSLGSKKVNLFPLIYIYIYIIYSIWIYALKWEIFKKTNGFERQPRQPHTWWILCNFWRRVKCEVPSLTKSAPYCESCETSRTVEKTYFKPTEFALYLCWVLRKGEETTKYWVLLMGSDV